MVEKEITSRELMSMLKAQVGTRGALKILNSIRKRLKKYPKRRYMSQEEFLKIVEEETESFVKSLP